MDNVGTSNKRIAKNTVFLYARMLLLMAVSFYTTRVVLNALGDVDYGVYNVVGGIVGFISFINGSMSLASNRFLAFAIGKNDNALLSRTFSMAIILHCIIGLIIVLIAETVGIWYFYNYLNIPQEKYYAAMWVYQLSVVGVFLSIMTVPLTSVVIAHERMSAFAYVSLIEGGLKLSVAFMLSAIIANKLILYACLMLGVTVVIGIVWLVYCLFRFPNMHPAVKWYQSLFKEMYSFVGWQFTGAFSWILRTQGVNLVLNYFFGPVLNAARTISVQVNSGVFALVQNFQMAVNPQLVKSYAQENITGMHDLLIKSSKYSFFLLYIIALPILLQAEPILHMWLNIIPDYTVIFVQLALISVLIETLSGTMSHAALATGNIKFYQPVVSGIVLMEVFLVYAGYKIGFPPQFMFYVAMFLNFITFIARLFILRHLIDLQLTKYLRHTTMPIILVVMISVPLSFVLCRLLSTGTLLNMFALMAMIFSIATVSVCVVGMSSHERIALSEAIRRKVCMKNL